MPPLTMQGPKIVHHMAALDHQPAPPNSIEAVQACLESAASFIEVDVTALADTDYLLVHDPDLSSETNGRGRVVECSAESARSLMIVHEGVQTAYHPALLSDVVKLFLKTGGTARLQLDFKDVFPSPEDEPLHRLVRLIEPLGERVIVSSAADWQLRKLRKIAPWLMLGFDIMGYIAWQPPARRATRVISPKILAHMATMTTMCLPLPSICPPQNTCRTAVKALWAWCRM